MQNRQNKCLPILIVLATQYSYYLLTVCLWIGAWEAVIVCRIGNDDPRSTDGSLPHWKIHHLICASLHGVSDIGQTSVPLVHVLIINFLRHAQSYDYAYILLTDNDAMYVHIQPLYICCVYIYINNDMITWAITVRKRA